MSGGSTDAAGATVPHPTPLFLCVGDIDVDVMIQVDRLPTRDGKVNGTLVRRVPGGMAGNVSAALAKLGARVRILGRVGDDDEATFALNALDHAGVATELVRRLAGTRTFSCIGLIAPDGEKSLVKLVTAAYQPSADELVEAAWRDAAHLHLTSVGDPAMCRAVVLAARQAAATASLDVEQADCPTDPGELAASIAGFDIVFCNEESRRTIDQILAKPLSSVASTIVTTLGAAGAKLEAGGQVIRSPGFSVSVEDTTGAGDCFAAACLHARIVQRLDWPSTLRFANCAAALSTERYGAQTALPTLSQVAHRLARSNPPCTAAQ